MGIVLKRLLLLLILNTIHRWLLVAYSRVVWLLVKINDRNQYTRITFVNWMRSDEIDTNQEVVPTTSTTRRAYMLRTVNIPICGLRYSSL